MKAILIWILIFILSVGIVTATGVWCYQESANVSNQTGIDGSCNLNYGGAYGIRSATWVNYTYIMDGNWSTYGKRTGATATMTANFTKPAGAVSAILQYSFGGSGLTNYSLPSWCFNNSSTQIKFLMVSGTDVSINCGEDPGVQFISLITSAPVGGIFGIAIWWNIASFSANLSLFDERTSLPINTTWNLEIWGDTAKNYTIIGTNITVMNLTSGDTYNLKYFTGGYTTRNLYIFFNVGLITQKLYVLNSSIASLVQYTIADLSALPITSATVSAYRKMMSSNVWELVEQSISDQNGQGSLSLEPYTANYKFIITSSSGATIFTSPTPQTISGNTLFFKSQVVSNNMQSYWNMLGITHNISFSNATSNLTFGWDDASSSTLFASLLVYQVNGLANTLVCNSTVNTSTGLAICPLIDYRNDSSNTYHSQGILYVNGSLYQVEIYDNNFASTSALWGISGVSEALLIVLIMTCMGLWNPSAVMVFAGIGIIISSWFGLIPLSYMWLAGLLALIAIALWRMKT